MVPVVFKRFTRLFLQGSHETAKDMPEFIRQAVRLLDAGGQTAVRCEEIKSTPELRLLCNGFHQDIELRNSTIEKIVDEGIQIMIGRMAETDALRVFLDDVLSG